MIKTIKHNLALKLDLIGFSASTLCAIHCALMPFIIVFLPVLGLGFVANPLFEYIFITSSVLIGIFTFRHGYFKHHRKIYPFALFLTGLLIIIAGHYFFHNHSETESSEITENNNNKLIFLMIAPIGASIIGYSHFINRKLSITTTRKSCNL